MIVITLNGEPRQLAPGQSLADLVAGLEVPVTTLATAVNGEFVPREARAQHVLTDGDTVFTFQAITGG